MITTISDLMRRQARTGPFTGYCEAWDKIMCVLCFDLFFTDELEPVTGEPGRTWDVCRDCAGYEKASGATY